MVEQEDNRHGHYFNSPADAYKAVQADYVTWTGKLSSLSVQAAYAIIAGNWVVHGTAAISQNIWALLSLIVVVIFLAINLILSQVIGHLAYKQCLYAEDDKKHWKEEFKNPPEKGRWWPYSKKMDRTACVLRWIRTAAIVISALLFIIGLFVTSNYNADAKEVRSKDDTELSVISSTISTPISIGISSLKSLKQTSAETKPQPLHTPHINPVQTNEAK